MVPQPRAGILLTCLELHGIRETPNHRSVWTGIPYMLWNVLFCGYLPLCSLVRTCSQLDLMQTTISTCLRYLT